MRLAHEPADAAGICCVANHTAGLIQGAYGDNRFKEPLALAFIYESALPFSLVFVCKSTTIARNLFSHLFIFPHLQFLHRAFLFCQSIQHFVLF